LESGSNETAVRVLQSEKHDRQKTVTKGGIMIVRSPQKWNATSKMGQKKAESRELQKEKQDLTDAGMATVIRSEK
jgi:hypothetical protein